MVELISDHLWQSTAFAAAVALLTPAFRSNRSHVRYWLWFAASVKFLIPFTALLWLGARIELMPIERSGQPIIGVLDTVARPFTQPPEERVGPGGRSIPPPPANPLLTFARRAATLVWPAGSLVVLLVWAVRWRRVARMARAATPISSGSVLEALRRLQGDGPGLRLVSSDQAIEPGVFGIVRPVLMWPAGIGDRLSGEQIEAILAHEVAHVRRRDNLAALVHMLVEAIFWFHPVVRWIGARLVDERERACDEDVVHLGTEPGVYAESILKTCQFSVESRLRVASAGQALLQCVAGVTGSDLKKRVEQIMRHDAYVALSVMKRLGLGAGLIAAIAIPVGIGIVTSPRLAAQIVAPAADSPTFEVASIRPNTTPGRRGGGGGPGRVTMVGMPVRQLIAQA
jgi:beta-lactamase regulating signal transducer with metallopeptidase domain